MARRSTKADLILKGARERVQKAQGLVDRVKGDLDVASAILMAHTFTLEQLEKDLAQTPRKVKDPKSTAPAVKGRSSRKPGKVEITQNTVTVPDGVGSVGLLPENPDEFHKAANA